MSDYCNYCMARLEGIEGNCPVCGKEISYQVPAHHLLPGTILKKKFYVGRALGEGGFGITYIGRDIDLDMKIAIKEYYPNGYVNRSNTISPQVSNSATEVQKEFFEKGRERFLQEARVLATFSGEAGVVSVRDYFEENNTAYIIMEYLDGQDLNNYLNQKGTLTPEQTIRLLMPVLHSLRKIHGQGLIHRDISPDNIMLVGDQVKLLDFGAARNGSATANKSLSVMLQPGYAPEEQYRSKGNQGPWTDVYALCATMYKCITGITPDDATQRVFSDEVKTPSALGISVSPEIENAIMRGMSVQQKDRYQNIDDLIKGLQGVQVEVETTGQAIASGGEVLADDVETSIDRSKMEGPGVSSETAVDQEESRDVLSRTDESRVQKGNAGSKKLLIGVIAGLGVTMIALVVVIVILISGNQSESSSQVTPEVSGKDALDVPENDSNDSGANGVEVVMSDELFDFTFELDGDIYQLPCSYSCFTENGWTISSTRYNSESTLSGNSQDAFYISKEGQKVMLYAYNFSGNTKKLVECKIGGIECYERDVNSFTMAKNITPNSTIEEIKEAFGAPNDDDTYDTYEYLTYRVNDSYYNFVQFCSCDDREYSYIWMNNFVKTEEDNTETSEERPAYLERYIAPDSLGNDIFSAVVELDGDLYRLPAPVSCFLDNGWTITQRPGGIVSGGTDYIMIERNGVKYYLSILNLSEYQTIAENCVVYSLSVSSADSVAVAIPAEKEITIGMSKENLESVLTEAFEFYDGTYAYSYSYYEYRDRDFSLSLYVDKETLTLQEINVSCKTWDVSTPATTKEDEEQENAGNLPDITKNIGFIDGNTYTNLLLGLGCTLEENWSFYSQAEIAEMYNAAEEVLEDQVGAGSVDIYEFIAKSSDGLSAIVVTAEQMNELEYMLFQENTIAEEIRSISESKLSDIGYADVESQVISLDFAGGTHAAIYTTATVDSIPYYQCQVIYKGKSQVASITVSCLLEDTTGEILGMFYDVLENITAGSIARQAEKANSAEKDSKERSYKISALSATVSFPDKYNVYSLDNSFTEEMCLSQGVTVEQMEQYLELASYIDLMAVPADDKFSDSSFEIQIKVKDDKDYGLDNLKDLNNAEFRVWADVIVSSFGVSDYSILDTEWAKYIVFDCKILEYERRYATVVDGKMIYIIGIEKRNMTMTDEHYQDLEDIALSLKQDL